MKFDLRPLLFHGPKCQNFKNDIENGYFLLNVKFPEKRGPKSVLKKYQIFTNYDIFWAENGS